MWIHIANSNIAKFLDNELWIQVRETYLAIEDGYVKYNMWVHRYVGKCKVSTVYYYTI